MSYVEIAAPKQPEIKMGCKNACFISKNPHDNQAIGITFLVVF